MLIALVISVLGLLLDGIGVYLIFYFETKPINKIDWDFSDYDKNNADGMKFPRKMGIKDKTERKIEFLLDSINDTFNKVNKQNSKRRSKSIIGMKFLLFGFGLQIFAVIIQICSVDANF